MTRPVYKTSIPKRASEKIEASHPNGEKKSASYFVKGEKVGHREWNDDGKLDFEYALRGGAKHGNEYQFYYKTEHVLEVQPYRHGHCHGEGRQWADDGRLLVTWNLRQGVGLDLWCDTYTETLAEEHYWPDSGEVGYTRLWNTDERTIFQEYFYKGGKGYHGIWREWNDNRRLRRGFPHFYINDEVVTKREYIRACKLDSSLVPYRTEDDDPHRKLPVEYSRQTKKRRKK